MLCRYSWPTPLEDDSDKDISTQVPSLETFHSKSVDSSAIRTLSRSSAANFEFIYCDAMETLPTALYSEYLARGKMKTSSTTNIGNKTEESHVIVFFELEFA